MIHIFALSLRPAAEAEMEEGRGEDEDGARGGGGHR